MDGHENSVHQSGKKLTEINGYMLCIYILYIVIIRAIIMLTIQ